MRTAVSDGDTSWTGGTVRTRFFYATRSPRNLLSPTLQSTGTGYHRQGSRLGSGRKSFRGVGARTGVQTPLH